MDGGSWNPIPPLQAVVVESDPTIMYGGDGGGIGLHEPPSDRVAPPPSTLAMTEPKNSNFLIKPYIARPFIHFQKLSGYMQPWKLESAQPLHI